MATDFEIYFCPVCGKKYKVKSGLGRIKCSSCKDVFLTKKSLTFLHTADLHLGRTLCDVALIDDQKYILRQIIDIVKEKAIDGVIIAGDIYDRPDPGEKAMSLFGDFLAELAKLKIKVFIIKGNHDSEERLDYGSALFETNKIFISAKYNGTLEKHTMKDGDGELDIYLLPYIKLSQIKKCHPEENIKSYDDALRVVLSKAGIDPGKRNILVAHQFVTGRSSVPVMSGSEGIAAKNVSPSEMIGADAFGAFDYVALGHIHASQSVDRYEIRYAGSPIKYSFSDEDRTKSVTLVTAGRKGDFVIETVPLKPLRDLRHIKGEMSVLLRKENKTDNKDYIYVTLTDEETQPDAIGIFRQTYPYTVRLDYDNAHTKERKSINTDTKVRNKSFGELVTEFYEAAYGYRISNDEMKVMEEIAREAGAIDEAG